MKKIIVFLLTAVLCLATLSIGMAAEGPTAADIADDATAVEGSFREGLHAEIYPIEKFTPVIDGVRDAEYQYSREVVLRDNGPEFAKGSIYYLWDDDALYFYVDIKDSTLPDGDTAINHESDCIEMLFSVHDYNPFLETITSKQAADIGDSQFRVMRTTDLSDCKNLVDTDVKYADGSHGGFGKWVYDNTNWEDLDDRESNASFIIHTNTDEGYFFEGYVRWSPELKEAGDIQKNSIIGLGIQVNDDINGDSVRDKKCYADNSGPNEMSMSQNRATCGVFRLVDNGKTASTETEDTEPVDTDPIDPPASTPETADPSVIFALLTVVSAGGFTVFAAKKSKND